MDVHLDDVGLTAEGQPRDVRMKLRSSCALFRKTVASFRSTIAEDKTAVAASTYTLAKQLAADTGVKANVSALAANLGVDYTAAKARPKPSKYTKWGTRQAKMKRRRSRLRRLRKAVGGKALKIYSAGVAPSGTYGAAIWGVSDAEARGIRQCAAAATGPDTRFRSLTKLTLIDGCPSAAAELAPLWQYARMVWHAVVDRDRAINRGASMANIRSWWESSHEQARKLVNHEATPGDEARDGLLGSAWESKAAAAKAWRSVRGPIAATAMTLERMGWHFGDPFSIVTDQGHAINLVKNSPAMVEKLATEGLKRSMEKHVGKQLA